MKNSGNKVIYAKGDEKDVVKGRISDRTKGIICITIAAFCFAAMGLFVRLSGDLPSMQKSFFRNVVALIVVSFTIIKNKTELRIGKGDLKFLILRAACGTVGLMSNFYAIDHLVLSDATMLNKLSPFFVIIFSYLILKEKINVVQGVSVVIAFIGALFIIKPTGNFTNSAALIGALGGVGAGAAYAMVRVLGKRGVNSSLVILFFSAFSTIACIPFMIMDFKPMNAVQLLLLICAGIAATGGQFGITKAYMYAPAKEISVYDYSQIVFSALMGLLFLGQIPDVLSITGYVIICGTALVMFIYNNRNQKESKNIM